MTNIRAVPHKPHGHHMACESVSWPSINADIDNFIKNCTTSLHYQQTQPKEKIIYHNIPLYPWEVVGMDIFLFNNKNYISIIDYNSRFPVTKKLEGLSAESLITTTKKYLLNMAYPKNNVRCWHEFCI